MKNKKDELSYLDKIRIDYLKYKDVLYDKITGLPTVPLLIGSLRQIIDRTHTIGIIVIDLSKYGKYERAFGWEIIDRIIINITEILQNIVKKRFKNSIIAANRARGDDIVLFLIPDKKQKVLDIDYLRKISKDIVETIIKNLDKNILVEIGSNFKLYAGYSLVYNDPNSRIERLIYQGIKEAEEIASQYIRIDKEYKISLLKRIIDTKSIDILFQPVVDLKEKKIIGYEALSRGPKNTELENPEILFNIATEGDLVWDLEKICREKALSYFNKLKEKCYLFLNNEPDVIYDPRFRSREILQKLNTSPENIVLEITERTAIKDFDSFLEAIRYFKSVGFKISIDDAGSGYASLKSIAILVPDFIKFDMSLIRGINSNLIKQNIVKLLIQFAPTIGAKVIAEGVETEEELRTVKELGVDYAQGFYFSYPGKPFPKVDFKKI